MGGKTKDSELTDNKHLLNLLCCVSWLETCWYVTANGQVGLPVP